MTLEHKISQGGVARDSAGHQNERIAFEVFKLALSYLYGKPAQWLAACMIE
jgi:hypothetical protein